MPDSMRDHWTLADMINARDLLLAAHYRLMGDPQYWYKPGLIDASAVLCVRASDFRIEIERAMEAANA